ncbi:MAG: AAA family ATPase [Polyangiaceae bacterium]|nr:AAA family ATPase [Polyangiaceae bacterium]
MPFVRDLELRFESSVTFFVGENGSGKSTLIEALADLCGLPVSGGGKNEAADRHGPELRSPLAHALRPAFTRRPPDSYFFRAEFQAPASLRGVTAISPRYRVRLAGSYA